ncbi:Rap guanine nucleotide exchange factor 2, partial [Halocaridina rubra]
MRPGQRASCNTMNLEKLMALEQDEITIRPGGRGAPPPPPSHHHPSHQYDGEHQIHAHHHHHHDPYLPDLVGSAIMRGARSRGSVGSSVRDGSDTSSAYSGSDTMCHSLHSSLEPDDVDLSGLTESAVDSDEEDLAESMESLAVRDQVRECLEKDPSERTDDDIEILLEFTQRLQAFSNMTLAVRRAMCQAMVFAVVEDAGTTLMNHGEELDSWSVIINGHVEVTHPDGSVHELHLGDSFGITPTMEKLHHQGVMRSKVDDCQFVCIRQTDYYCILHQGEENTRRIEENGIVVLVTEQRPIDGGNRKGNIVIKGTADKLMCQLVEVENNVDPTYVEDFLLTHRTFVETPLTVANKLLQWFEDPSLRDRVTRVVLLWVNNHFTDFEMDLVMMNFLEQFEEGLEREKMAGQLRLLDFACATKARARVVTLTRPSREDILHFSILGGYERGYAIFISKVEKGSKAEEVGLKRGDQILEVNGQSFDHMNHARALEILRQPCHLSITVKSNLLAFKEMLTTPENSPRPHTRKTSDVRGLSEGNGHMPMNSFSATGNIPNDHIQQSPREKGKEDKNKAAFMTIGVSAKQIKKKIINSFVPKPSAPETQMNSDESVSSQSSVGGGLYHSHSNPDLTTAGYEDCRTEFPEHVLKVYRATDHNARFLPVHKETTAREVVMLALQIFNINDPTGSSNYALYEVTVTEEGITKQRRLPDSLQNLAERIGLSSRYYLKNITVSQTLVPDDIVNELVRESAVYFLQLNSVELAIQLTLEDYTIFRQVEPTEYIDYLFNLKSNYGTPALSQFAG